MISIDAAISQLKYGSEVYNKPLLSLYNDYIPFVSLRSLSFYQFGNSFVYNYGIKHQAISSDGEYLTDTKKRSSNINAFFRRTYNRYYISLLQGNVFYSSANTHFLEGHGHSLFDIRTDKAKALFILAVNRNAIIDLQVNKKKIDASNMILLVNDSFSTSEEYTKVYKSFKKEYLTPFIMENKIDILTTNSVEKYCLNETDFFGLDFSDAEQRTNYFSQVKEILNGKARIPSARKKK